MTNKCMDSTFFFIGGVWLKEEEERIIENSKGNVQTAANVLQWNIINGIDSVVGMPTTVVSAKFLGSYPCLFKKLFIHNGTFNHSSCNNHVDYSVGFINIPYYKHYSRYWHMKKIIRSKCENDNAFIIGYSMTFSTVKSLLYAKRINPLATTCLVVPDLPEYMRLDGKQNLFFRFIKKHSIEKMYKLIQGIDSFSLLTEQMNDRIKSMKPYVVVEGIAPDINEKNKDDNHNYIKRIVYTGSLGKKYGVCDLVDSFVRIKDENIRLSICGAGDSEEYIVKKANEDPRIEFLGVLPNDEARKLQRSAYLLVNPRSDKEEYTKYSFPSKTMEYMVSGRAVLTHKLPGIPKEYDDYLFYVEDSLEISMRRILELPENELYEKGEAAKLFVLEQKNKTVQSKKIVDMLTKIKLDQKVK